MSSKKTKSINKSVKETKTKKNKKIISNNDNDILSDSEISTGGAEPKSKTEIKKENLPVVVKIPNLETDIFDTNENVTFSTNIDYPRSEYGFHHFIHNNKNKTEKLKIFDVDGKKKVYLVFNRFEKNIDNYDKSISNLSKDFFSSNNKPEILTSGFYKFWEILMLFNLINVDKEKFVSAHFSEGPGSFVQATMYFRDVYAKKHSKSDKYYTIDTNPEDIGGKDHIPQLEKNFIDFYSKEKPNRLIIHETFPKSQSGGSKTKTNGDIIDPKTIKLFGGKMEDKADLITGDANLHWINENIQEQEAFRLIISQIIGAVKLQKKEGNFVCKFYETFTKTSLKIISILKMLYDEVTFIKPLTSELSNSEKYVVCTGFKYSDKDSQYKKIIKKLDAIHKSIYENKNNKIVDIFPEYSIPKNLIRTVIELNKEISNPQLKNIGEIISFVEKEIYSGDEYHTKREEQIEGALYWTSNFLPDLKEFEKNTKTMNDILNTSLEISSKEIEKLNKLLVHVENQN